MNNNKRAKYGDELYEALTSGKTIQPFTERDDDIPIDDAYHISLHMVRMRRSR
ncbi:hypothetical protein [Endozoicomonas lisbonensis]|uniref:2-keto-4-pentenoate hydratase n=1 Tax=Endozoicomonas lisbonensis TaxID=3120522 RepID=A0ABV2SKQ7_9GAMM